MTSPRILVQLSDPHIKHLGTLAYGRVDTAGSLQRAVSQILRMRQPAEAIIITGDLTDFGRREEYEHLRQLLSPLSQIPCPIYLMPGNHDARDELRRAFFDHPYLSASSDSDFVQYSVNLGGLRLVTVDTVVPMASHGAICEQRLAALDVMLRQDKNTPTIVAMHHPPFRTFIEHMDEIGLLAGADAMECLVASHPQVKRVICGHLHRPIQALWANTIALTAPSTAHQVRLDLAADAPSAFVMEPPGFLIHAWDDTGQIVTHQVTIGEFGGPYPFYEDGTLID